MAFVADRDLIEMQGEPADDGELRYTRAPRPPQAPFSGWPAKILGTALGVAIFLALAFFFVYVVLPVVAVLVIWGLLKNLFGARR